jgi:glycosyltransferase involved in cell wall biosynthesis
MTVRKARICWRDAPRLRAPARQKSLAGPTLGHHVNVNGRPLVSVIVPACNAEGTLAATLDAARAQTYRNLELIVVDDGSSDGTRGVAQAHAARDARVRVIEQENRGVSAARNCALAVARGEFVAPLDADDLWDPSKIERQVRRMLDAGATTGLVYSWWVWIDEHGAVLDGSPRWRVEGHVADALLQVNFIGCGSIPLFRRRHLEAAGGYDETLPSGCDDWDLALRVAERARVAVVPAVLVGYRRRQGSMSTATAAMWRSHEELLANALVRRPDIDRRVVRRSRDQFALYLAGLSYRGGSMRAAIGWGLRSLRSSVAYAVLPSIAKLLRGRRRHGTSVRAGEPFAQKAMPEPLIPYDRIYARRFARHGLR